MSSTNLNTVSYSDSHRRSYITTGPFSSNIFSYTTSMNNRFVTVGSLTAKSVPSGLNVAGTILRENGRKLYPGANPGISTYMVGVYHETIGSAFIDPNAHVFAVYSGSKPYFAADGVDPDTDEVDWSAPVYTRGVVYAQGDITTGADLHVTGDADISGSVVVRGNTDVSGATIALDVTGNIVATQQIRSSTVTLLTVAAQAAFTINPNLGQVHFVTITGTAGVTTNVITTTSPNNIPGAVLYIIVANSSSGNQAIDFNDGFRSENAGNFTVNQNTTRSFMFVSDGTNFFQVGSATTISQ